MRKLREKKIEIQEIQKIISVSFFILAWRSLGEEGDTWRLSIESWNTGMSDSEMRICRESRLTGSPHPNPLGIESNPIRFLPTGEGAPSKLRGLGEFLLGGQGGIISPCGFGQSPRFSHASAWFGGEPKKPRRAHTLRM